MECLQFILPPVVHLFLFTVLVVCFEWKKNFAKYILHTRCILAEKKNLICLEPSKHSRQFAVETCCSFSSQIDGILTSQVHVLFATAAVSSRCPQGTRSNHLWSSYCLQWLFMYHNLFASSQFSVLVGFMFIDCRGSNDAWKILNIQTGRRSADTTSAINPLKNLKVFYAFGSN